MTELSEIAQRILSELEEAGAENVPSTMNTVLDVTGSADHVGVFQGALAELIVAGQVYVGFTARLSGRIEAVSQNEALEIVKQLPTLVRFDSGRGFWSWHESKPLAEIIATTRGKAEAASILDERGYQWWRRKEK